MRRHLALGVLLVVHGSMLAAVPVRIATSWAGEADAGKREVFLRLEPRSSPPGVKTPDAFEVTSHLQGEVELDLPSGVFWQLSGRAAGTWSAPLWFDSAPGLEKTVSLRLFPSGTLRGRLDLPKGTLKPPDEIELRFRNAPGRNGAGDPPPASVGCPVTEGAWHCEIPLGELDLRLRIPGLIPVYLWGTRVERGKVLDLGLLAFKAGSSVAGRIQTEDGSPLSPELRLTLEPQASGAFPDKATEQRLGDLSRTTTPNERGFFQFEAVAPGIYAVTAAQKGFAPVRVAPLEVREGLESEIIAPLVLVHPVALRVEIDPPVDPYGEPWQARLQARDELTDRPGNLFRGTATPDGLWTVEGLAPGQYHLDLLTDSGSSWVSEPVEVRPGETSVRHVQVPVLEVRGRVRQGKDPWTGTLWLGGRFGSRRIRLEADAEGRFDGFLPGPGRWNVELLTEEEMLRLVLDPVVIRPLPGKSYSEVEIQIPNTRLRGEVVDEKGKPLPEARLRLFRPGRGLSQSPVDKENGEIDVRGLPPGLLGVEALEGERTSGWTQVVLEEGRESPWLRLVVRDLQTVQGRVVSSRGGVPGATVRATPWVEGEGASTGVEAVTGPQGDFSLSIPAPSRALGIELLAPGFAMRMLRAEVEPGKLLELLVEPLGGSLIVEVEEEGGAPGSMPLVHHGGTMVPLQRLGDWARLLRAPLQKDGRFVIPEMEPGEYTVCAADRPGAAPPADSSSAGCTSGVLAPFGELVLRLPSQKPQGPAAVE